MAKIKLYRPANGTEGSFFEASFCDRCKSDVNQDCEIHLNAMLYEKEDEEYPKEWRYQNGKPTCTAFEELKDDTTDS